MVTACTSDEDFLKIFFVQSGDSTLLSNFLELRVVVTLLCLRVLVYAFAGALMHIMLVTFRLLKRKTKSGLMNNSSIVNRIA